MQKILGGTAIARVLKAEGVKYLFTLPVATYAPLYKGCADEGIEIIGVRHEQATGYIADGWARATGEPAVCAVIGGAGIVNMASALMGAHLESSPLVAICTQSESGVPTVKGGESRRFDPKSMFSNYLKWVGFCGDAQEVATYVRSAFKYAMVGRKGPVILEVSRNALYGDCEYGESLAPENYRPQNRQETSSEIAQRVLEELAAAERPLMLVGDGIYTSNAWPELRDFARFAHIPVVTKSGLPQGYLPESDPLFAGVSIFNRPSLPTKIVPRADVVLALGCVFDSLSAFPPLSEDAKLIQVNLDPTEIGRSGAVSLGIAADPKTFLKQLHEIGSSGLMFNEKRNWLTYVATEREAYNQSLAEIGRSDAKPIKAARLVTEIRDFVDEDTYVITDGSDVAAFGRVYFKALLPGHIINSPSNWGNMGAGVPLSIGVKLAKPDKKVLLMTSDGSFGFNGFEMETASRYSIPIVVVIGNNHSWASDHNILLKSLGEKYSKDLVSWLPESTRYDKFAESMGCYGQLVTEPSEIRAALERAFESGRPSVLDVRLEKDDAWPSRTQKYAQLEN